MRVPHSSCTATNLRQRQAEMIMRLALPYGQAADTEQDTFHE